MKYWQEDIETREGKDCLYHRFVGGVSFVDSPKLRHFYEPLDLGDGNVWVHDWKRPGDFSEYIAEYTACRETGEIIVAKRIKSHLGIGEKFMDAMWEYERQIQRLADFSLAVYGTCDHHSPMWRHIEEVIHDQQALACKYQFPAKEYRRIFFDRTERMAHGVRPLPEG